jgi:hypothetical protein
VLPVAPGFQPGGFVLRADRTIFVAKGLLSKLVVIARTNIIIVNACVRTSIFPERFFRTNAPAYPAPFALNRNELSFADYQAVIFRPGFDGLRGVVFSLL